MYKVLQRVLVTASLVTLGACGGGGDGGADDMGGDGDAPPVEDTTAPLLQSSTPTAGEAGVAADAVLQLVFSEPMDQGSVENALATSPFEPGEANLTWNLAGDTLTITPNQPLARAEGVGADPSQVQPIAFEIKVGTGATDLAGNHLEADVVVGFTTEKLMSLTIAPDKTMSNLMNNEGGIGAQGSDLIIGDGALAGFHTRALLTFDLASLPAAATGVKSASLGARQKSVLGTPYADLGNLVAHQVSFEQLDLAAFAASPKLSMGSMSQSGTLETKSVDVSAAVQDDYANFVARDGLTQYRLAFAIDQDNKGDADLAVFGYDTIGLVVVYTAE